MHDRSPDPQQLRVRAQRSAERPAPPLHYSISPIERLTKVIKVLSGKTWRKRAKERHHSEDSHDEKKNVPALKRAADFMNDLRLDVYTITRMVGLVMDDMQKLYGFHMAKQRQRLHAFETGFDKLFVVFHSALGAG